MGSHASRAMVWAGRRRAEKLVGVSMVVSGSVHGLLSPEHFNEWWGYGVFFLVASACLLIGGLALLTDAIDPRFTPGNILRLRTIVYSAAILGNLALVALYLLTRVSGIPLGPGAGTIETVQGPDLVAKLTEAAAIFGLAVLLWKGRGQLWAKDVAIPPTDAAAGAGVPR